MTIYNDYLEACIVRRPALIMVGKRRLSTVDATNYIRLNYAVLSNHRAGSAHRSEPS